MSNIQDIIEGAFEDRANISPSNVSNEVKVAVIDAIGQLDSGKARVAEKVNGEWVINEWLKKAVLLSFRIEDNSVMPGGATQYYDKVPPKFANQSAQEFEKMGVRIVPNAMARRGSYIAPNTVLMPSFVNIGAYVDKVYIGKSTKIYNRETGEVTYGRIPAGSVVVSGNLPSKDGKYSLYCVVIVKQVDEKTRSKVGINELLRSID